VESWLLIWLELEIMPVFWVGIILVNDDMSVEDWFDESGKDWVSLTTCEEDAGFRC